MSFHSDPHKPRGIVASWLMPAEATTSFRHGKESCATSVGLRELGLRGGEDTERWPESLRQVRGTCGARGGSRREHAPRLPRQGEYPGWAGD